MHKFCIYCKYYKEVAKNSAEKLDLHYDNTSLISGCSFGCNDNLIDLVTGQNIIEYKSCHIERSNDQLCGAIGKNFVPLTGNKEILNE